MEHGVATGVRLQFQEWHIKLEGLLLHKVWIWVTGIRKRLREYLNLWAIGSMLRSTQMVDMVTMRKNDFGRILVTVVDPALLPSSMDGVIGDHYFELKIEKEKVGFNENGDEVELDFRENGDDGDGKEENNSDRGAKRARPANAMEEDNNTSNGNPMELCPWGISLLWKINSKLWPKILLIWRWTRFCSSAQTMCLLKMI